MTSHCWLEGVLGWSTISISGSTEIVELSGTPATDDSPLRSVVITVEAGKSEDFATSDVEEATAFATFC